MQIAVGDKPVLRLLGCSDPQGMLVLGKARGRRCELSQTHGACGSHVHEHQPVKHDAVVQVLFLYTASAQDARCALPDLPQHRAELHPQGV